jgi:cellobiose phosphorylase
MSLVGIDGKGESVWLGFFLYMVLKRFAPVASAVGDSAFATQCETECATLQQNLETNGWDGEWYRRAYFDDGTPLGSASNSECKIDSIAQSWSVLSGAANITHAKAAMDALNHHLVDERDGLIKLLTPPFDKATPNPGYIKGYVPGIRENGGQYTHAAIWATMAFAQLGEIERAWQLFHILNPINHGRTEVEIQRYKIEPYVVAADVYSVAPHTGRGGWSWYTGSAAWLYRLIIETLLGIRLEQGNRLRITPMLPNDWPGFSVDYIYGKTLYKITVSCSTDKISIVLDGILVNGDTIALVDDEQIHQVQVNISRVG